MIPIVTPDLDLYYPQPGMKLKGGRYEMLRHLGSGQYSTVWLAFDFETERLRYCAIKILTRTATREHRRGRMNELPFLKAVMEERRGGSMVVKMFDDFEIEGPSGPHICLVFQVLSFDVTTLRRTAPNNALKPYIVKKIVSDVLDSIVDLHSQKIIHTDLKGSNILLYGLPDNESIAAHLAENPPQIVAQFDMEGRTHFVYAAQPLPSPTTWDMTHFISELQGYFLTDLGQGQWAGQQPTVNVVTPLALRAPEIVIGSNFGPRLDVWAVGCLTFELLVGEWLFNPVANGDEWSAEEDLLAQIFAVTGQRFSETALSRAQWKDGILDKEGKLLRRPELPPTSIEARLAAADILPEEELKGAADFIGKCLTVEYLDRPTSEEISMDDWPFGWQCGGH